MISWISNLFGFTTLISKRVNTTKTQIFLKDYVDLDLDIMGLFAQGHYSQHDFLAAVRNQNPHTKLSKYRVRQTWAQLTAYRLIEFDAPTPESEPITLIEIY